MMHLTLLLHLIDQPNRDRCFEMLYDNETLFNTATGSNYNHQTWSGGYLDHVTEVMNIAIKYFKTLNEIRKLPFTLSDALLVLFLHDLEKPWKQQIKFNTKEERFNFRLARIGDYNIELNDVQLNALRYVEGENDDYSPVERIMNELAAFCHICDVTSSRIWYDYPKQINE